MPKVKTGLNYQKNYDETNVSKALAAIEEGMSQRKAALYFNVPRSTLQFRKSDKFENKITHGPRPVLSQKEEQRLEDWIFSCHQKGFPLRDDDIKVSVKNFLDVNPRENPFVENLPRDGWMRGFLKRHPKISFRTSEAITSASSAVSESDIKKWFVEIETYLTDKNLSDILKDPDRIFNADETCFLLCPKNKKVLAPRGTRNVYEVEHHPKKNLTVMFTFSASGITTPPMIIYAQSRLPATISNSVPDQWGVGYSDNGWMKNELFYEYVGNVLYPYLKNKGTTFPVILFVDGHSTHLTYQISQLCTELQIILISLYPNATRIMQPADVSAFKPLKNGWKLAVLEFKRQNPNEIVTKENFAIILKSVIEKYLKSETIQNGFRACGLFPWNSSAIDYSKCVGKNFTNRKNVQESVNNNVKGFISLPEFRTIIGEDKYTMLERMQSFENENEDLLLLYKIYKKINENDKQQEQEILETDTMFTEELQVENINIEQEVQNTQAAINSNSLETGEYNLEDEIQNTKAVFYETLNGEEQLIFSADGDFDIEHMPVLFEDDISGSLKPNLNDTVLPSTSTCDPTLNSDVTDVHPVQPCIEASTSTHSLQRIDEYLVWPKTPERKGKRQSVRLPFVLTSSARKKAELEKIKKKKQEEYLKEKRKTERLEKKQLKEKEISAKKKKNLLAKKTAPKKKSKEKDTENLIIGTHVSDVSIKPIVMENFEEPDVSPDLTLNVPKHAKRILFNNANDLSESSTKQKTINIISNIVVKEKEPMISNYDQQTTDSSENRKSTQKCISTINKNNAAAGNSFFKNPVIITGMCFKCTKNITSNQNGLKCSFCRRTYHIQCATKYRKDENASSSQLFSCPTCLKSKIAK